MFRKRRGNTRQAKLQTDPFERHMTLGETWGAVDEAMKMQIAKRDGCLSDSGQLICWICTLNIQWDGSVPSCCYESLDYLPEVGLKIDDT